MSSLLFSLFERSEFDYSYIEFARFARNKFCFLSQPFRSFQVLKVFVAFPRCFLEDDSFNSRCHTKVLERGGYQAQSRVGDDSGDFYKRKWCDMNKKTKEFFYSLTVVSATCRDTNRQSSKPISWDFQLLFQPSLAPFNQNLMHYEGEDGWDGGGMYLGKISIWLTFQDKGCRNILETLLLTSLLYSTYLWCFAYRLRKCSYMYCSLLHRFLDLEIKEVRWHFHKNFVKIQHEMLISKQNS